MGVSSKNEIASYMHCRQCVQEWRDGKAPGESPSQLLQVERWVDQGRTPSLVFQTRVQRGPH